MADSFRKIIIRNDTEEAWTIANPVLSLGELGVDITNRKIKLGDGSKAWNSLLVTLLTSEDAVSLEQITALLLGKVDTSLTINNKPLSSNITITKSDINLSNIDNTSDIDKPLSTSTISALNIKADKDSPTFTGSPVAPTQLIEDNSTKIASTAFCQLLLSNLIGNAPPALNQLNKLASAIGNDPTFSTTILNLLSGKELTISTGLTSQYFRGDKSWQTLNSTSVGLSNVTNDSQVKRSELGVANGVATLGTDAKIVITQLPDSVLGALKWQSGWNASTNTPTIPTVSSANNGWYYIVTVAGSTSEGGVTDWKVGDWIVSDGVTWIKVDNTDAVSTVFGRAGAIVANSGDYTADQITETATRVYITPTQKTVLSNTSNTNTGDETVSTIKTKLGITTITGSNTGDQDLSSYAVKTAANIFTKTQTPSRSTISPNGNIDWDASGVQVLEVTLTASRLFNAPTNLVAGTSYMIRLIGAYIPTWNTVFKNISTYVSSTTTTRADMLFFYCSDGTNLEFLGAVSNCNGGV